MSPRVSVVVPVYNSAAYVGESLQSVFAQTLPQSEIELIVVDDGSTDGSGSIVDELCAGRTNAVVIHQANSGSPGAARNPGIDRATGDFIFFLDADDLLAPDALRRMASAAEREGSDVVLGKMAGSGGRRPPMSMFKRTRLDADILRDNLFTTLGPWKLFRRSMIEGISLRFPTDRRVGTDQPFVAAAYLNAKKISVLADMDYYVLRSRDDGGNITNSKESAPQAAEKASKLAEVVVQYTEPGEFRDAVMRRPYSRALAGVFEKRFLEIGSEEQLAILDMLRRRMGPYYNDRVAAHSTPVDRAKNYLAFGGHDEELTTLVTALTSGSTERVVWDGSSFVVELPEDLDRLVPEEVRRTRTADPLALLDDLRVEGSHVVVLGRAGVAHGRSLPDAVSLRLQLRGREGVVHDFTARTGGPAAHGVSDLITFEVDTDLASLGAGTWDAFLVIRYGDVELVTRYGARKAAVVRPEGYAVGVRSGRALSDAVVFWTKEYGNLSVDIGQSIRGRALAARLLGLIDGPGTESRAVVDVMSTSVKRLAFFATVFADDRDRKERLSLEWSSIGPSTVIITLPRFDDPRALSVAVEVAVGDTSMPLVYETPAVGHAFIGGRRVTASSNGRLHVAALGDDSSSTASPPSASATATAWAGGSRADQARRAASRARTLLRRNGR